MVLSRVKFESALLELGLLSEREWQQFLAAEDSPQSWGAERLAITLVERGQLTNYQANEILQGRGTPLVLDDYVITDRLGAGDMGAVFKAWHRRLERVVAIKVVAPQLTSVEAAVKRFQREARAAARLIHPNIVTTFDAGEAHGHQYLVMEFVEGRDLSKLAEDGPLPVPRVLHFILQAAEGLEYAHASGVIHRDIKPANLLIDRRDRLRILDLGIAQITHSLGDADGGKRGGDGLTQTGFVMGTVDYMAPEQGNDIRNIDARCDIYSLGCTLYRLLTGQVMYDGDTFMERFQRHVADPIPRLRASCPEAPPELERVFRQMVAKKRNDRFADMAAVRQALLAVQQLLANRPTSQRATQSLLQRIFGRLSSPDRPGASTSQRPPAESPTSHDSAEQVSESAGDQEATNPAAHRGTMVVVSESETNANAIQKDSAAASSVPAKHWQQKPPTSSSAPPARGTNSELAVVPANSTRRGWRTVLGVTALLGVFGITAAVVVLVVNPFGDRQAQDISRDEGSSKGSSPKEMPPVIAKVEVPPPPPPPAPPPPDYSNKALEAMNALFTTETELIEKEGAQPQRKETWERMLMFYRGYLEAHAEDSKLADDLAEAKYRLARCDELLYSAQEALPVYEVALALQEQLVEETPENTRRLEALAKTRHALGRASMASDNHPEAQRNFAAAVEVLTKLTTLAEANSEYRRLLANEYLNLGISLAHSGQNDVARRKYEEAQQICTQALQLDPENWKLQRMLAFVFYNSGILARKQLDDVRFKDCYRQAAKLMEQSIAHDRADLRLRRMLAGCYWDLSLASTKDLAQAREYNRQAQELLQSLVEENPDRADFLLDQGRHLINVGMVESKDFRHTAAMEAFTKARDILQPFERKANALPTTRRHFGVTLKHLGAEQLIAGNREEGLENLRQAAEVLGRLAGEFPDNQDYATQLKSAEQLLKRNAPPQADAKTSEPASRQQ